MILDKNEDLMKQVEAQNRATIWDLTEIEKQFADLEGENDLLRNTHEINIQEVKKDVHYNLLPLNIL